MGHCYFFGMKTFKVIMAMALLMCGCGSGNEAASGGNTTTKPNTGIQSEAVGNFNGTYIGRATLTTDGVQKEGDFTIWFVHQFGRIESGQMTFKVDGTTVIDHSIPSVKIQNNDLMYESMKIGSIGTHDIIIKNPTIGNLHFHQDCLTAQVYLEDFVSDPPATLKGNLKRISSERPSCRP